MKKEKKESGPDSSMKFPGGFDNQSYANRTDSGGVGGGRDTGVVI